MEHLNEFFSSGANVPFSKYFKLSQSLVSKCVSIR